MPKLSNCNSVTICLYTMDYKGISMSKEKGFIIVGLISNPEQANEIQGIVKLSILGFRMQDLSKEV